MFGGLGGLFGGTSALILLVIWGVLRFLNVDLLPFI